MQAYRGVKLQLNSFLTLALDGDEWSTAGPGRFTPGKESWCPLDWRVGGPQSQHGRFGAGKISCSFRNSNPGPSNPKLVAVPTNDIPTPDWVVVNELEET